MKKKRIILLALLLIVLGPVLPALALPYGSGLYGSCQYNTCSITLSSNIIVNIAITPVPTPGTCSIDSGVANVLTDDSNGFSLTLGDASTNTSLLNGSSSIATESGTFAVPAKLSTDTWGYRVDSQTPNPPYTPNNFGSGPTSSETDSLTPSATPTFAGIQPSNLTPDTILNYTQAADPAVNTNVFYGVCADTNVAPGEYMTSVVYTAVTN